MAVAMPPPGVFSGVPLEGIAATGRAVATKAAFNDKPRLLARLRDRRRR